jgi:tetratricopeptide (TPR) repeat protein
LGEIYAAQGEYAKALEVFEILLEKNPHETRFQKKIDELKRKLNDLA